MGESATWYPTFPVSSAGAELAAADKRVALTRHSRVVAGAYSGRVASASDRNRQRRSSQHRAARSCTSTRRAPIQF